ncbi:MAG: hypothetical protein PHC51_06675 [bacterium]|nr:hypothetical protein [bacterium]
MTTFLILGGLIILLVFGSLLAVGFLPSDTLQSILEKVKGKNEE